MDRKQQILEIIREKKEVTCPYIQSFRNDHI